MCFYSRPHVLFFNRLWHYNKNPSRNKSVYFRENKRVNYESVYRDFNSKSLLMCFVNIWSSIIIDPWEVWAGTLIWLESWCSAVKQNALSIARSSCTTRIRRRNNEMNCKEVSEKLRVRFKSWCLSEETCGFMTVWRFNSHHLVTFCRKELKIFPISSLF